MKKEIKKEVKEEVTDMAVDEVDNASKTVQSSPSTDNGNEAGKGTKRAAAQDETGPLLKKLKKNGLNAAAQTPLALLNELRTGLNYKIEQADGPPHCPNFLASVEVDGIVFHGSGNAKKLAKQRAAEAALLTLCPSLLSVTSTPAAGTEAVVVMGPGQQQSIDFTADPPVLLTPTSTSASSPPTSEKDVNRAAFGQKIARTEFLVNRAMSGGMNPVMALNELFPGLKYDCIQESSQKSFAPFVYTVTVNNEVYKGTGNSKKAAKSAAARAVLLGKYEHLLKTSSSFLTPSSGGGSGGGGGGGGGVLSGGSLPQPGLTFLAGPANQIAELVLSEYQRIMTGSLSEYARRKVLAAVVMTRGPDCSQSQLISLGTGTKCISGDHISVSGAVLNDCHAEIISRRGLIRFLYSQLSLHSAPATAKQSIFVYDEADKCYKLKPDVKFHLYISTSPCGDARIFSPHEGPVEEGTDRHPNRQSRGQLRTKIESGEGTIPVKSFETIQTWDGVMQGERLLTMSCSDKLGKWNVVGVQGSLLSHFIEPIYLHSVVIGSLFHPTHLRRALFSRIENSLEGLPPPYRLNKVLMNTTTSPEARQTGKAPNHAVNWVTGESDVEVVNAVTGKTLSGNSSRLCKQRFFGKFVGLLAEGIQNKSNISIKNVPQFYADIKNSASNYQEAKSKMVSAFLKAGLGVWKKKPLEQDQFGLDVGV